MGAMTMPFEARPTNELSGLSPGDTISFRMRVTETDGWIDQIKMLSAAPRNEYIANYRAVPRRARGRAAERWGTCCRSIISRNQLGEAVS